MTANETRSEELFGYAADHAEGFTNSDAMGEFDWTLKQFNNAARALRDTLGDDEITLVCEPGEYLEPWVYKLVGTYDDAQWWAANRIGDTERRLTTMGAVMTAVVHATDGRSIDGRKARKIQRSLSRLAEDLEDIEAE